MRVLHLADAPPPSDIRIIEHRVQAGFPSPAADYCEGRLDFNELLVKRPAATFCVRISGTSMVAAGINDGSIVVVDRSIRPTSGRVVVAVVDGSLVVKRLRVEPDGAVFLDSHPAPGQEREHPPIAIFEDMQFEIWGCVSSSINFIT